MCWVFVCPTQLFDSVEELEKEEAKQKNKQKRKKEMLCFKLYTQAHLRAPWKGWADEVCQLYGSMNDTFVKQRFSAVWITSPYHRQIVAARRAYRGLFPPPNTSGVRLRLQSSYGQLNWWHFIPVVSASPDLDESTIPGAAKLICKTLVLFGFLEPRASRFC